ncbi:uroporphyrinogen-III synthase [Profundibacterium mesophilum]|uniref:Uroporphyrinogen-III synthase n=1 Tax=Profundibacterium mesophilum KAUST100406-0324 TaxID=1037889 RepID=A0A921TDF6_9RHOB|nr:uroporphyrinogen-III synthase [Profundibacterium mesophilum]KAF0676291.1 uroporphyrinogen-III synthase [Profundibacterium mesophilum KAUST100406-0324]
MPQMPALLLTRPGAQSHGFAQDCRAAGFAGDIVVSPILSIVHCRPDRPLEPDAAAIFTSVHGVEAAAALWPMAGRRAFAVGARTAAAARAAGAVCLSSAGDMGDLVRLIVREAPDGPLRHLHGTHLAGDLAGMLAAEGFDAAGITVYAQEAAALSTAALGLLRGRVPVIVPLFSPRSAMLLSSASAAAEAPVRAVAMSAAVAACWNGTTPASVVPMPTARAMLDEILRIVVRLAAQT